MGPFIPTFPIFIAIAVCNNAYACRNAVFSDVPGSHCSVQNTPTCQAWQY